MSSGTDQYADAAGLVARSAAAYVSSVPTDPADDGFFGPASVTWRVSGDLSSIVAGLRALLVQALHPLAWAGWPPRRPTSPRSASATGRRRNGPRPGSAGSTSTSAAPTR